MQNRIKELEEALATTETLYRQSRAKCEQLNFELRREKERADKYALAINLTLDENGHLADGDICTLKALKDAVGIE